MKKILLALILIQVNLYAEGIKELGIKTNFYDKSDTYSAIPYLYFAEKITFLPDLALYAAARASLDIPKNERDQVDPREFYLKLSGNHYTVETGLQIFNWGETFGVNILDLVNPRDYHEFIFDDLTWSQIPVWSAKLTLNLGELTFIPIYTIKAEKTVYPTADDYFDFVPESLKSLERIDTQKYKAFKNSEYGFKLNYLFFNNLDLSLIYFNHYNRRANFVVRNGKLYTENSRIQSYGITFSYDYASLIFRGDTVQSQDKIQAIYGVDRNFNDNWVVGMQYHLDKQVDKSWGSFRVKKELERIPLTLAFMDFFGLDNDDFWLRPEVSYNAKNGITYQILADLFRDDNRDGMLQVFNEKNRISVKLNYLF